MPKLGTFYPIFDKDWEYANAPLLQENFDHFELLPENKAVYEIKKLGKVLQEHEIIIHAPFVEANLVSADKTIRHTALHYYQNIVTTLIATFNPHVITLHAGQTAFYQHEIVTDQLQELFKNIPSLALENLPNNNNLWRNGYPHTEDDLDAILARLDNPRITFDVGHWLLQKYDVSHLLRKYAQYIVNIHIHDVVDEKDHKPLGTGELDIEKFAKTLKEIAYDNYLTIEMAHDDIVGSIDSMKILRRYLK